MQYRKLGKTSVEVSIIGFGASALGNVFGTVTERESKRAVSRAIDQGINFFSVSPYYGLTLAEARLGQALGGKRSGIVLATKCGRYGTDDFDFSGEAVTRNFEESLRRLDTEYVDLLQPHEIEFGDFDQILNETLPAMYRLREQGKVRFIGVTGYWPDLLTRMASRADLDCVLNYCRSTVFVDDMDVELTPIARSKGLGLLNASPLNVGLLARKAIPDWRPAPLAVRHAALRVSAFCERHGIDPASLALKFCPNHADVVSIFVGLSNETEVTAACKTLQWAVPFDVIHEVQSIIAPVHNLVWPSGLKKNQEPSLLAAGSRGVSMSCTA